MPVAVAVFASPYLSFGLLQIVVGAASFILGSCGTINNDAKENQNSLIKLFSLTKVMVN